MRLVRHVTNSTRSCSGSLNQSGTKDICTSNENSSISAAVVIEVAEKIRADTFPSTGTKWNKVRRDLFISGMLWLVGTEYPQLRSVREGRVFAEGVLASDERTGVNEVSERRKKKNRARLVGPRYPRKRTRGYGPEPDNNKLGVIAGGHEPAKFRAAATPSGIRRGIRLTKGR